MTTENTNPSVPANNTTPQGEQQHGDEIDLVELAQKVWAKRKMILRNTAIGAVVGIVVAFSIPKEYKTTVKLAPENSGQSGAAGNMGALAAMAGINLGGSNVDGLTPLLYPDIVMSTPFLMEFKDLKVLTLKQQQVFTLYEYLSDHQKSPWWSKLTALPGKILEEVRMLFIDNNIEEQSETWSLFYLTQKQKNFISTLATSIDISEDKKTGVITLGITMQDAYVAALVADSVISKLQSYMINYKTEKSRNDLAYAVKLYDDAQQRYYSSQKTYAQYEDANKNIISASYAIEKSRLENEVSLTFSIYNSLAQQVEMAKAKVQQDTPVLTVLEPAKIELQASKPNKKMILVIFVFISVLISLFYTAILHIMK